MAQRIHRAAKRAYHFDQVKAVFFFFLSARRRVNAFSSGRESCQISIHARLGEHHLVVALDIGAHPRHAIFNIGHRRLRDGIRSDVQGVAGGGEGPGGFVRAPSIRVVYSHTHTHAHTYVVFAPLDGLLTQSEDVLVHR